MMGNPVGRARKLVAVLGAAALTGSALAGCAGFPFAPPTSLPPMPNNSGPYTEVNDLQACQVLLDHASIETLHIVDEALYAALDEVASRADPGRVQERLQAVADKYAAYSEAIEGDQADAGDLLMQVGAEAYTLASECSRSLDPTSWEAAPPTAVPEPALTDPELATCRQYYDFVKSRMMSGDDPPYSHELGGIFSEMASAAEPSPIRDKLQHVADLYMLQAVPGTILDMQTDREQGQAFIQLFWLCEDALGM